MPEGVMGEAAAAVKEADCLLVIGTTLIVAPANELPTLALRRGTPVVIINPFDESPFDSFAAGLVRQKAGAFLAEVGRLLSQRM
eukprot:g6239.t1